MQRLRLRKNADRRLKGGHLWLYSNEIDIKATPLKGIEPGEQVIIEADNGREMGVAYVNPNSLICARIVSRDPKIVLDRSLLVHRFNQALSLRKQFFSEPYYRLVHGESDLLPGLVIDRFDDIVVVQANTQGMAKVEDAIIDALEKVIHPCVIVMSNDTNGRRMEGLPQESVVVKGELPEDGLVTLIENGVTFQVSPLEGQKTGWFYDHRSNRAWLNQWVEGKRVLDVFSYVGGWGIQAAAHGAAAVTCVDASGKALDAVGRNAELNGVADRMTLLEGDA